MNGANGWPWSALGSGSASSGMEQRGCRYVPHVVAMQAGQTLRIANRDDTVHSVHPFSERNQQSGIGWPAGEPYEKTLSPKDKLFPGRCDMHSWMSCYVQVFDQSFFTVSDARGRCALPGLPAGTYTVTAQHETLGKQEIQVTVSAGATATADFCFEE